jgi:hypothetical protein
MLGKWRFFTVADLTRALEWAAEGNVAVHDTGVPYKQHPSSAHVFAQNGDALIEVAAALNLDRTWIRPGATHPHYSSHFVLFGAKLVAALKRCRRDGGLEAPAVSAPGREGP